MKIKIAMLCYRVARWLAPAYFDAVTEASDSLNAIGYRYSALRKDYEGLNARQRNGAIGKYLCKRIKETDLIYKSAATVGEQRKYEEVKVEIAYDEKTFVTRNVIAKAKEDPKRGRNYYIHEEAKQRLFSAVVNGFAQSAEIDKFLYFREINKDLRTIGIRLYLKHE